MSIIRGDGFETKFRAATPAAQQSLSAELYACILRDFGVRLNIFGGRKILNPNLEWIKSTTVIEAVRGYQALDALIDYKLPETGAGIAAYLLTKYQFSSTETGSNTRLVKPTIDWLDTELQGMVLREFAAQIYDTDIVSRTVVDTGVVLTYGTQFKADYNYDRDMEELLEMNNLGMYDAPERKIPGSSSSSSSRDPPITRYPK